LLELSQQFLNISLATGSQWKSINCYSIVAELHW